MPVRGLGAFFGPKGVAAAPIVGHLERMREEGIPFSRERPAAETVCPPVRTGLHDVPKSCRLVPIRK
ncbi:hypothetical protein TRIP_B250338 [uncultured Desulfatiglans sp.]|nr:hypothetical protein TRIP_B250338 [uncultured Desulfatiglans sp.]